MYNNKKNNSISVLPSTIADALNKYFLMSFPGLIKNCVFDPELTYENSIMLLRANILQKNKINIPKDVDNNKDKYENLVKDDDILPFLSWNRSYLGKNYLKGAKNIKNTIFSEEDGKYYDFEGGNADFTYNFTIFSKNPIDLEKIEVKFSGGLNKYFSNFTNLTLTIKGLGTFPYNLVWNDLDSTTFNISPNYYQSLTGSVLVCGLFFTATQANNNGIINDIEFNIGSCCGLISDNHFSIVSTEDL